METGYESRFSALIPGLIKTLGCGAQESALNGPLVMPICYAMMSHSAWRMFWFAFSCCDKHDQKQLREEQGLSSSHWLKFIKEASARAQGRNLEIVTEAMAMEDCDLPAGSFMNCSVCFCCTSKPHAQRWRCLQWVGPSHTNC